MFGKYELFTPHAAVEEAVESIRGLEPEEIGDKLEQVQGYATLPLPYAYKNYGPIVAATLLLNNALDRPRDGTGFYAQRLNLTTEQEEELDEKDRQALDAAKKAGGLDLYARGKVDKDVSRQRPTVIPFTFVPTSVSHCEWESTGQARNGSATTEHGKARRSNTTFFGNNSGILKFDVTVHTLGKDFTVVYQGRSARQGNRVLTA